MDALAIAEGSTVADIGAGAGWFTIRLARRVGPNGIVYAQDVQRQMLEAIRRRVAAKARTWRRASAPAARRTCPSGALDAVLVVDVYPEVEARPRRVPAQPGGRAEAGRAHRHRELQAGTTADPGPAPDEGVRVESASVEAGRAAAGLRVLARADASLSVPARSGPVECTIAGP